MCTSNCGSSHTEGFGTPILVINVVHDTTPLRSESYFYNLECVISDMDAGGCLIRENPFHNADSFC